MHSENRPRASQHATHRHNCAHEWQYTLDAPATQSTLSARSVTHDYLSHCVLLLLQHVVCVNTRTYNSGF